MKTLTTITAFLVLIQHSSCDSNTSNASIAVSDTLLNSESKLADTIRTGQPGITVIHFLTWYCNQKNELSSFQMVNNATGESFDSTKFYSVNFQETEKYLNTLKASGYVSDAYVKSWRNYFMKADLQFKANPQSDGPPENFDYDFIFKSQEIDEDLQRIDKIKIASESLQGGKAAVTVDLPSGQKLKASLSREKEKWLIDNIENAIAR